MRLGLFLGVGSKSSARDLGLFVNGDFSDWTGDNPDNWTVISEDANNYVTEQAPGARMVSNNTATVSLRQVVSIGAGNYAVDFVKQAGTGEVRVRGDGSVDGAQILALQNLSGSSASGTFSASFSSTTTQDFTFTWFRDNAGNTDFVMDLIRLRAV